MTDRCVVTLNQDEVSLLLALLITSKPVTNDMVKTIQGLLTKLGPFSANIEKFPHRPQQ